MADAAPQTSLDSRYSSSEASATPWEQGRELLEQAQLYWISTVRPDGRPHVTPLIAVWLDGALHFCTGEEERKARNLVENPHCVLTTGCNTMDDGLDVVVEGEAVSVTDEDRLRRLAEAWVAKYGEEWRFDVRDGAFHHAHGRVLVFEVAPRTVFGFGKGETFSQTRWRF
jgi:nitroimidazol reductase NimA-like FMN-containing flavoprotein (pyridoxamine 5'-phosphate oxidase superfamily)